MSKKCEMCGKEGLSSASRSFSMKQNKKRQEANLHNVRVIENGSVVTKKMCTSCIKKGNYQKAV